MGKEIEQIAVKRGHSVVLKITSSNSDQLSIENLKHVNVAIEFSKPENAYQNILTCFSANVPVVAGTTGWLQHLDEIKKLCQSANKTFFYASNFSIGVHLFFKLNSQLAEMMSVFSDYTISIEEIHHIHKLDSPSGTAISLANQIIEKNKVLQKWVNNANVAIDELPIISTREGEVIGTHSVNYNSSVDTISIKHLAKSRKGFALGAVIAAEFLQNKNGYFSMDDLLKIT